MPVASACARLRQESKRWRGSPGCRVNPSQNNNNKIFLAAWERCRKDPEQEPEAVGTSSGLVTCGLVTLN